MLFILGWNPENNSEISLHREPVLFASVAECEAASGRVLTRISKENTAIQYEARCVEFPDRAEMEDLFKREFGSSQ